MAALTSNPFSIGEFLGRERQKDLLRFSTAGSVDDGKSTLIGRLLYDTQSVYEDQVRSIQGKGTTAPGQIDFALLTDGLRAEREQGITIDVAYRYFSTARRKFIIADTPGHEQYTRNMATGASTADAAVVLVDAGKGILIQSRRHAYIASLLGVRHLLVAVNKMDLVGYREEVFRAIESEFAPLLRRIAEDTGNPVEMAFIPVSALAGDNVARRSNAMPWYNGPALLEVLESLPASEDRHAAPFRFPVQRVVRPHRSFRGFAGQIASGTVAKGSQIVVLPSGKTAAVTRIVTWDGDLDHATAPLSVTLMLDRELDVSRGDLIAAVDAPPVAARRVQAALVWMDQRPLQRNRRYLVKHTSQTAPARVAALAYRTNVGTLEREVASTLELNEIGLVHLDLLRPMAVDRYADNRATGAFILIDPESNATVAAGMVTATSPLDAADLPAQADPWGRVTAAEREARWGHRGAVVELNGPAEAIDAVERSLFSIGAVPVRLEKDEEAFLLHPGLLPAVAAAHAQAGLLALVTASNEETRLQARAEGRGIATETAEPAHMVAAVHRLLYEAGILISAERAGL